MRFVVAATLFAAFLGTALLGLTTEIKRAQEIATFDLTAEMHAFVWSQEIRVQSPDTVATILTTAADRTGANLVRRTVRETEDGRLALSYHLRTNHSTALIDDIHLSRGRMLTGEETRKSGTAVSTVSPPRTRVVGEPAVLADGFDLTILPFAEIFTSLPAAGPYEVEVENRESFERFLEDISEQTNVELLRWEPDAALTTPDTFTEKVEPVSLEDTQSTGMVRALAVLLGALVLMTTIVALARDAAAVGVMRMHGYSLLRIWWSRLGKRGVVATAVAFIFCSAALPAVPGMDLSTACRIIAVPLVGIAGLTLLASGVGLLIINRMRVSDLVKGRFA